MIESPVMSATPEAPLPAAPPAAVPSKHVVYAALALIMSISFALTVAASRTTSTTFDEIIMVAGGARGFETGRFDLAPEHPPFTQYMYGLPVFLDGVQYPPEPEGAFDFSFRYLYSRQLFWESGNDPERVAFLGRLPAALAGALTVLLAFAFTRRTWGAGAGLLAATLVAFLPDMLAHGGVAYNDLPLATAFLACVWTFDRAARTPDVRSAALAGAAFALALSIKFSAVALLPVALLIVAFEALAQREQRLAWLGRLAVTMVVTAVSAYALLVLVYRGDFALVEFRYGLDFTFRHVGQGHGAPAYLLGRLSPTGWWYFFPVAFLFKTPAALHVLALLALLGYASLASRDAGVKRERLRALFTSPMRAPVIALLVFGWALLTSSLNIGFRYTLPVLPLLCIIIAVGAMYAWQHGRRPMRAAIVACALWYAGSVALHHPHYLSYISEYGPGGDRADLVLLDSSVDWGQGLLALRDHMQQRGIERIYLSYFGSGDPAGYGISFIPLPSFFPLVPPPPPPAGEAEPAWVAVSATNLHGVYLPGDPMAQLRQMEPDTVLANSIFLYRIND